ncbi:MAG: hypothetical protein U0793_21085 [Gemmataceae bacterium]
MLKLTTLALLMSVAQPAAEPIWQEDYTKATDMAIEQKKDLVIYFRDKGELDTPLDNAEVKKQLGNFICLKLPVDYKVKDKALLEYSALEDMTGKPGLVVVSYHDKKLDTFATPISVHPVASSRYRWVPAYGAEQIKVTLNLPAHATLSQRSMIYAICVHPEAPQSVYCTCHPAFLAHACNHCARQAGAQRQHHADLASASNSLRGKVERGFSGAQEVVAESWGRFVGGENVLEASFSCIDAWRHSPGHWGAVAGRHTYFGYDIARAANGTWYATGIFGH